MFPRYHMKHRPNRQSPWEHCVLTIGNAGGLYDSGLCDVQFGDVVILNDAGDMREMTDDDKRAISRAADRHSESK